MTFLDMNPVRLGVLLYLRRHGPASTPEIRAALPDVGHSTLLRHLGELQAAGYVNSAVLTGPRATSWSLNQPAVNAGLAELVMELGDDSAPSESR